MVQQGAIARSRAWPVVALGLAVCTALWTTARPDPRIPWAPGFLRGYALAWACYVLAALTVSRSRGLPRWVLALVLALAVAMRVIALARTPSLSTDAYRYLWDGRVANAGINPYSYPPDARELRSLRDHNWRRISFRQVPTVYPPLAQLLFAALARARDSDIELFRWTFAALDVGTVLLLMALLRRTGRPPEQVVWYAWCPLAVTETTAGGHVDAAGVFLLIAALLLVTHGRRLGTTGGGVALAGAVMIKGYAVLALPMLVRRGRWPLLLSFAVACLGLTAPFASAGAGLIAGLRAYLGSWKANASIFLLLDHLLAGVTAHHLSLTRALTAGAVLTVALLLTARLRPDTESLLQAVFLALGAQLLLGAPTFPWYVIWVVPALCWWRVPALALFTFTVSAQYYARWLYLGDSAAHRALLWAGYLPVYALLIGQFVCSRVAARRPRAATEAAAMPSTG